MLKEKHYKNIDDAISLQWHAINSNLLENHSRY